MYYRISLFFIAMFASLFTTAQGIYIEGGFGYGLPLTSNTDMLSNSTSSSTDNFDNGFFSFTRTDEVVPLNLGKGFNFAAAVGYMFNDIIGAELQVSYLVGAKTTAEDVSRQTTISGGMSSTSTSTIQTTYSSTMWRITPSIVVQGDFRKVNPYAKLGLLIGFGKTLWQQDDNFAGFTSSIEADLSGGVAFGVNSRLGVIFELDDLLSLFVEAQIIAMNYNPTKGEITKYVVDGDDVLSDLTTNEREVEFVDSVTFNSEEEPNPDKPFQVLTMSYPFSSVGVNLGVRFTLGN
jgi:hypothetical protein